MASPTDYKFAGTAAAVDRSSSDLSILNPNNAKADDTTYTGSPNKSGNSDWLELTNFGFSSDDIPDGSTIVGIEFIISRYTLTANNSTDSAIYLRDESGQIGSNMASGTYWPITSPQDVTYGGATNMCGTSLTQADIVASTFGIDLSFTHTAAASSYVDYIKIRVYYTEGGGATVKPHYYYLQQ